MKEAKIKILSDAKAFSSSEYLWGLDILMYKITKSKVLFENYGGSERKKLLHVLT